MKGCFKGTFKIISPFEQTSTNSVFTEWPLWIICEWSRDSNRAESLHTETVLWDLWKEMREDGIWDVHYEKKKCIDNPRTAHIRNIPSSSNGLS